MSFFVVKACNNKDIMDHQLKITSLINSIVTRKLHEENAYISWWLPFLHLLIFQCTKWALYKIALVKSTISNPFLNWFVFYGIENQFSVSNFSAGYCNCITVYCYVSLIMQLQWQKLHFSYSCEYEYLI